jgi:outer membrane murein-binding lipoprotein Lpp
MLCFAERAKPLLRSGNPAMAENPQDTPQQAPQDPLLRIAEEVRNLTDAFVEDSRRDRLRIYLILVVAGIGLIAAGGNVWRLVEAMNDDMESMSTDMRVMKGYMASMHQDMGAMSTNISSMRNDMETMSGVMKTMDTMGPDVRRMTGAVDQMALNVDAMSKSVGFMSTMTPAVQKMSGDTGSMTRDMHWMMPFNWMPFR